MEATLCCHIKLWTDIRQLTTYSIFRHLLNSSDYRSERRIWITLNYFNWWNRDPCFCYILNKLSTTIKYLYYFIIDMLIRTYTIYWTDKPYFYTKQRLHFWHLQWIKCIWLMIRKAHKVLVSNLFQTGLLIYQQEE